MLSPSTIGVRCLSGVRPSTPISLDVISPYLVGEDLMKLGTYIRHIEWILLKRFSRSEVNNSKAKSQIG